MLQELLITYLIKAMNFSISGTKKQLLNIEKKLQKLGIRDDFQWNDKYRDNKICNHIIVFGFMNPDATIGEYSYHSHSGGTCIQRYDIVRGHKFLNKLLKQQKNAEKSKGDASKS